jgi:hypothetical protein
LRHEVCPRTESGLHSGPALPKSLRWRTAHASPSPRAGAASHLASTSGRTGRPRHRPGPRSRPAHRPSPDRPPSTRGAGRHLPVLRPVWGGNPAAQRVARAGRPEPAPRSPHLGGGPDPRDAPPPIPRRHPARDPHAPTLAAPGRPRPGPGRATARPRLKAGRAAPPGLADGRDRIGAVADRPADLLAAGRR